MKKNKRRFFVQFLWLILTFLLPFSVHSQKSDNVKATLVPVSANYQEHKLNSKLMAREMPYRVVLPKDYEISKSKTTVKPLSYPVIYLLHGLMGHFDNWTDKTKLAEQAAKYNFIIVMPEGNDGWYTDSASEPNDRYESYIIDELIPEIDKKFRTLADKKHRVIAGLSMGGYGSIKFGLKHSNLFSLVGSFSGALGAADWTEEDVGTKGPIAESILTVFGAADTATRKDNNIFQMVRDISAEKTKELPFIYLDCGTEDFFIQNNLDFVKLLREKKIPHEFRELPGKHDWNFWGAQVQEFLELTGKFFK